MIGTTVDAPAGATPTRRFEYAAAFGRFLQNYGA
jgi:hypothetical protein